MTTPINPLEAREILRLDPVAEVSPLDVKKAYRAAAKLHHPDTGSEPDPAEFARCTEAARLLAEGDRNRSVAEVIRPTVRRSAVHTAVADVLRTSIDDLLAGLDDLSARTEAARHNGVVRAAGFADDAGRRTLRLTMPNGTVVEIIGSVKSFTVTDRDGTPYPITLER